MSTARSLESWGRYPRAVSDVISPASRFDDWVAAAPGVTTLPFGRGRSYGDSCLNDGHRLLHTRWLDRLISFDDATGVLRCEAGVGFDDLLPVIVPRGWFLPVTPGTKFVTVGGAVANDVHGKNHHQVGTFGHFVDRLELRRSDGSRIVCSPTEEPALFHATIGGLGLTGLILWVEFRLARITSQWIDREAIPFSSLSECLALSAESAKDFAHTVAWMDCLARGAHLGRGVFFRGNVAPPGADDRPPRAHRTWLQVPFDFPSFTLNRFTVSAFNAVYRRAAPRKRRHRVHYEPFFYPLDAVGHWNRIYGRGLVQWQCVIPADSGDVMHHILNDIANSRIGSFLAVFKTFGEHQPAGLMSFPRPGLTLALDFPLQPDLFPLLERLDAQVREAGGAIYPAKDSRMSRETFQTSFPRWEQFAAHIDPNFSSSFWRRVTGHGS